ncbi:F-box/kelch-repeat protein [Raphanus sativus]|nr:F-box/kelch-repeat protein [Raphanus sativus]
MDSSDQEPPLKKPAIEATSIPPFLDDLILNSPPVEWSDLVAVDHRLYAINKEDDDVTCCSSNVFFLDCRTHTWVETPSLRFAHTVPGLNGKMYLAGSYEVPDSLNCVEEETSKERFTRTLNQGLVRELLCDTRINVWRKVEGLEGLPKFGRYSNVKLVDCGGKLVVFWDKYVPAPGGHKEKMIWCAEISLETRGSEEEVWGKVEWFDAVLKVPKSYRFVYASTATV